jgi:hypothetical protein
MLQTISVHQVEGERGGGGGGIATLELMTSAGEEHKLQKQRQVAYNYSTHIT